MRSSTHSVHTETLNNVKFIGKSNSILDDLISPTILLRQTLILYKKINFKLNSILQNRLIRCYLHSLINY